VTTGEITRHIEQEERSREKKGMLPFCEGRFGKKGRAVPKKTRGEGREGGKRIYTHNLLHHCEEQSRGDDREGWVRGNDK